MPETKLNVRQKLFAALEALVKETEVKNVTLDIPVDIDTLPFTIDMANKIQSLDYRVPSTVMEMETAIKPRVNCIVEELTRPRITDASISDLNAAVVDEQVEILHTPRILDADTRLTGETIDFFKTFGVEKKLKYNVTVKNLKPPDLTPKTRQLNVTIYPMLKENLGFFNRLTVNKKPVVLSYLSEKEQLHYWKMALIKTRKDIKKLKLLGVYTGIPRDSIENIKVNFSTKSLNYNFKTSIRLYKKEEPLRDMALFDDLETGKSVMVSK
ncbi:MAG: hypothetical protein GY950_18530 [bacterium]|nr:hypothetical protein [bacterium]